MTTTTSKPVEPAIKRCPGCRQVQRSSAYRVDPSQHGRRAVLCLTCEAKLDELQPVCHYFDGQRRCECQAQCAFYTLAKASIPPPADETAQDSTPPQSQV